MAQGSAEDRLIARYFKPLAKHPGAFGLTDDAAAITPPAGHDLVLKTDGLIAGVHFFPEDLGEDVGRKALRVNLSDLAAKGAAPLGFLLAIALPKNFSEDWLAGFTRGLGTDADNAEILTPNQLAGFREFCAREPGLALPVDELALVLANRARRRRFAAFGKLGATLFAAPERHRVTSLRALTARHRFPSMAISIRYGRLSRVMETSPCAAVTRA